MASISVGPSRSARAIRCVPSMTRPSWPRMIGYDRSGAGKSTVLDELRRRGHFTVDTDYNGWVLPDRTWDEGRMKRLLAQEPDVVVSGTVENQGRFYETFEHVVLVSAPLSVLLGRARSRSNTHYGRTTKQQAEIASYVETVEPLLRHRASIELDGQRPVAELADVIEGLMGQTSARRRMQRGQA